MLINHACDQVDSLECALSPGIAPSRGRHVEEPSRRHQARHRARHRARHQARHRLAIEPSRLTTRSVGIEPSSLWHRAIEIQALSHRDHMIAVRVSDTVQYHLERSQTTSEQPLELLVH